MLQVSYRISRNTPLSSHRLPRKIATRSFPSGLTSTKLRSIKSNRSFSPALYIQLEYHEPRLTFSYGEAAFTLNFFANGTDNLLSVPTMGSFFRNQSFPENWYRRSSPGLEVIGQSVSDIISAHPIAPGANAPNGTYVLDPSNNDVSI